MTAPEPTVQDAVHESTTEVAPSTEHWQGVRLDEFQLLNWGTFDGAVQRLALGGANALLTGQVGAGKSTIVDGLTTLFAAPNRITFNKAAGADRSERSVSTYVLGHYRNVFDESTGATRADALRSPKSAYSVLLARFSGLPGGAGVLSAGVIFYFESGGTLHRMYLTAPTHLDIAEHLVGHADARAVRSTLRALGAEVYDENFKNYQRSLCRQLGIGAGALDLLVQTVSMKSVGNLTAFVRTHMLDAADPGDKIADILAHWDDLNRAYELVLTAREQLRRLEPVAEHAAAYDRAEARIAASREAQGAVARLVEQHRVDLLGTAIADLETKLPILRAQVALLTSRHEAQNTAVTQLTVALQQGGGAELARAEHQVELAERDLAQARSSLADLQGLARAAQIAAPEGRADWARFSAAVTEAFSSLEQDAESLRDSEFEAQRVFLEARGELKALNDELQEAGRRDSNVPLEDAALRARIADELGLEVAQLPYAAELIAVAEGSGEWEAAAERLVRPLGLSLLVGEEHYSRLARWVDGHHLGRRLVYYRVPAHAGGRSEVRSGTMAAHLAVRPRTPFTGWLSAEVARRYDHVCVEDADKLGNHTRAVTRAGQIKDNARHEKDDRRPASDRRHYVLGWDTAARRSHLQKVLPVQQGLVAELGEKLAKAGEVRRAFEKRGAALEQIRSRFVSPAAIDVGGAADALTRAQELLATIAGRADLVELTTKKKEAEVLLEQLLGGLGKANKALGDAEGLYERWETRRSETAARLEGHTAAVLGSDAQEALADAEKEAGGAPADVERCDAWGRALADALSAAQSSASSTLQRNGQRLVAAMKDFANQWPGAVAELGTEPDARDEYLGLMERLRRDDLPAYESDFRTQLQTNAIHELVALSFHLDTEARKISDRIATINSALVDIDYRPGTYIRLENEPAFDPEIREFRAQLRDITSNTVLEDEEAYAEERFLKVKALLDRFKGREGSASADLAWTKRVTDVRNWHSFAASERTKDEDAPVEHYTDSGGKSGGQKEKLAYTILAASLSYQYGLAGGRSESFRFVMIDEAFGRGSDESTRFGLELFERLRLQLLVVTPLQKIATIEPFVEAVGYVRNEDPRSRLVTMTVGEYRENRDRRRHERTSTQTSSSPGNAEARGAVHERGNAGGLGEADVFDGAVGAGT